jgi:Flp pilus assembly protein TadG
MSCVVVSICRNIYARFGGPAQVAHSLGARRRAGSAAVEAALILPVFLLVVLLPLDLGLSIFTQVNLDAAVESAARAIQIGTIRGTDPSAVRTMICNSLPSLVTSCGKIQVYATSGTSFGALSAAGLTANGLASGNFATGGASSYVLLEVAYLRPSFFPALEGSGAGWLLLSAAAFSNEP